MKATIIRALQGDGFRVFLKRLGIHHLLDFYFRNFPKNGKYANSSYVVDSLEGWLLEKEIFKEEIYDGVFDLKNAQTFCDLGCNRGFFSLWTTSKIGKSARGLLIEANPNLIGQVGNLLRVNDLSKCLILNGAVGAGLEGGSVDFLIPPTDVGAGLRAVASDVLSSDKCELKSVPALHAGRLWEENFGSGARCNLLKVDIEGGEWRFLKDERNFLSLVDRIVVEVHTKMGDENELLALIEDAGFNELARNIAGDGVYLLFADRRN